MGGVRIACQPSDEAVETRTTVNCTMPSVEDFKLTIEGVSLHYTKEWDAIAQFHEDNYLYKGEYKAVVEAGDVTVEGYDDVAFRGEQPFTVVARQNTEVAVTAHIANAMIKVEYTDNFLNYFTGGHDGNAPRDEPHGLEAADDIHRLVRRVDGRSRDVGDTSRRLSGRECRDRRGT